MLFLISQTILGQPAREKALEKLAKYAVSYYQFSRLDAHTTKIYKLPSFVTGLDSNEVYSIREILDKLDKLGSGHQDSVLAFIKKSLGSAVTEMKDQIANPLFNNPFDTEKTMEFRWLDKTARFYLNTVDSVLDINFDWQKSNKGWLAIERNTHTLKSQALMLETGKSNTINGSTILKKSFLKGVHWLM